MASNNYASNGWRLFGFKIQREKPGVDQENQKTFALPSSDDGAVTIQTGAYYGTYVDLEGIARNEIELITRYREMAMQPEIEAALDDVINEAIVINEKGTSVKANADALPQPAKIKKRISDEFQEILKLLNFGSMGHDIFKRWYVDGRLFYHVIIDEKNPTSGIKELRYIDPRRIRKIREIQRTKDPITGIDVIKKEEEYYMYNERGIIGAHGNQGARISPDAIINVNSGLLDSRRSSVLSYLHKAIKPLNNLRMVEDATVIYRISRAAERRVFYIDVGNLPKIKAEQYMKDIMTKYRNKLVYDSETGETRDDRRHLSMLEDFWLPRRDGSKGTEIQTLPSGQNLGQIDDVVYFQKKLYAALGVPMSRMEQQGGISFGRIAEITRDELKFARFISRLRNKFGTLFDDILRIQLVLKGVCTAEEWNSFKEDIWYDYLKDNNYNELKEAEVLSNRLSLLSVIDPYLGRFFSLDWIKRNILQQNDEEIAALQKQMDEEKAMLGPIAGPFGGMQGQGDDDMEEPDEGEAESETSKKNKTDAASVDAEEQADNYEPLNDKMAKLRVEHAEPRKTLNIIKKVLKENYEHN